MKRTVKQWITLGVTLATLFTGVSVFAASFDLDPAGSGTGFASINSCLVSCANQRNSLSVNIPNPGDEEEFYIFVDFRNSSSGFITSPYAHLYLPSQGTSSSVTIDTALTGGYAPTVHDSVTVTNLPPSWKMEFVPGSGSYVQIPVHTLTNHKTCEEQYGIQFSYTNHQFSNPQSVAIPTSAHNDVDGLDYQYAQGWCQQGFVTYKVKVTNTTQTTPTSQVAVKTLNPSSVGTTSAVFRGSVVDGDTLSTWFVYNTTGDPVCSQTTNRVSVAGMYNTGDSFSKYISGLQSGTTYYYRACGSDGQSEGMGDIVEFRTDQVLSYHWEAGPWGACVNGIQTREVRCVDQNGNEDPSQVNCDPLTKPVTTQSCSASSTLPEAETLNEEDVRSDEAVLNGRIRMNAIDDGLVFFVYGMNRTLVDHVDGYSQYSDIPEDGQELQKVAVDTNNDEDDWRDYSERVGGLESGERYYYRICVQYNYAQSYEIRCGSTESFVTDTNGSSYGSADIETLPPETVGSTIAKVCGDLKDDGGNSSLLTWIEYRKATASSYRKTTKKDRGEGRYCEVIRNLTPGTRYAYRACSEDGCGTVRYFRTTVDIPEGEAPQVTTGVAYDIGAHSAKLPAIYVSNADRAVIYFKYGRSRYLNKRTRSYTVYGSHGEVVHNFTNLKSDQYYCYQAVIETRYGTDEGAVRCFYTLKANGGTVRPPKVITVKADDKPDIDLEKLGLGLSLIQLEIDDQVDAVSEGQQVTYMVRWKNISKLTLRDLELNVEIPREVQILGSSRGMIDRDRNSIFYTIDRLDPGEEGSMTVTGLVVDGNVGDALTANATIAFANPVNGAQENATDYDVDTFVLPVAGVNLGAGSIFGLGNVTLLGWLTILLGLLIIFLIARWLYLEREDLRAHAYANRMYGGYYPPEPAPRYREPARPSIHDVPSQRDVEARNDDDPGYRPYRPRH